MLIKGYHTSQSSEFERTLVYYVSLKFNLGIIS